MATIRRVHGVGSYTLSDLILVIGLGLLGGLVNSVASSIFHQHFRLWGAQVPYAAIFVLAPVIAMLLVRKPGVAFAAALIYGIVQAALKVDSSQMVFGILEGLGAEMVFALFRYRRFDALSAFLAGGIGGRTLENLWTLTTGSSGAPMMMMPMQQQYAPWQTFVGGEILALIVFGIFSGLLGWALARLIERTNLPAYMRSRWDHATPAPQ